MSTTRPREEEDDDDVDDGGVGHHHHSASSDDDDEEAEARVAAAAATATATAAAMMASTDDGKRGDGESAEAAEAAAASSSGGGGGGGGSGGKEQQAKGGGGGGGGGASKYRYAVVCSSNVNRSMEAHVALFNNRLQVDSYGAGRFVRLPVPGGPEGRTFDFGTPYETMLQELLANADSKAQEFYKRTKLTDILRRNHQIKRAPERWQDLEPDAVAGYDIVVCFEQRIYDAVVEGAFVS